MSSVHDNADLLVNSLSTVGIDFVFGVPGGAIEPFFDALARRGLDGPQLVVARHETGAAFMAEGYARETGKMGVCCSTTGPGATNLITGVASAYAEETPLLVITAQTALRKFGRNALQESSCTALDILGMFRHCTRYNTLVSHREQFATKLSAAIMAAHRSPQGPAHISVPSDVFRAEAERGLEATAHRLVQRFRSTDAQAVEELAELFASSKKPVMFLGKDCGEAIDEIIGFAERTGTPFVSGPGGKRWMDAEHRLYRGVFGFAGHQLAERTIDDPGVDLILAVGAQITELGTGGWHEALLGERLVHVGAKPEHFARTPMARLHVHGDLRSVFQSLHDRCPAADRPPAERDRPRVDDPGACESDAVPLKPQRLMTSFTHHMPDSFRVFVDAGNAWAWCTHYFLRPRSAGHYHIAMALGSMGWAIGAAVGSAVASRHATVCITGDGSFLMAGQEITVAIEQRVPVVFVVLNDGALGMVKHGQRLGNSEPIGFGLPAIDFSKMAEAMGAEGIVVQTPAELDGIDWRRLGAKPGPTLIDVRIDPEEPPPMAQRVRGLAEPGTPGG